MRCLCEETHECMFHAMHEIRWDRKHKEIKDRYHFAKHENEIAEKARSIEAWRRNAFPRTSDRLSSTIASVSN